MSGCNIRLCRRISLATFFSRPPPAPLRNTGSAGELEICREKGQKRESEREQERESRGWGVERAPSAPSLSLRQSLYCRRSLRRRHMRLRSSIPLAGPLQHTLFDLLCDSDIYLEAYLRK